MLGNIGDIEEDEKRSLDGAELDLGHGRILYVRRAGGHNWAYRATLARVYQENVKEWESTEGDLTARALLERRLRIEVDAASLVASWKGFQDEHGNEVDATPDLVAELFSRCPDVHQQVTNLAEDPEGYRVAVDTKSDS